MMDAGDLWCSNQHVGKQIGNAVDPALYDGGIGGDLYSNTEYNYDLLSDQSWFSEFYNKTLAGTIPFIFQADGDAGTPGSGNNNPDQFAICRLRENSLTATQTAPGLMDFGIIVEEVW